MQITKEKTSEGPALFPAGDRPAGQSMLRFTNIREILFELIKGARESGPQLSLLLLFATHLTPHRVGTAQCLLLLETRPIRSR